MPKVTAAHKEARRQQIRAAAMRCFSRDGFHGATMDQIIAEAGLSAGAVYQYFPSKRALILDVAASVTGAFADLVEDEVDRQRLDPPAVAVPRLIERIGLFLTEDRSDKARTALQGWAEAVRDPELAAAARSVARRLTDALELWLERWRGAGMIGADVDPAPAAPVMLSLLLGMLTQRALIEYFSPEAYAVGIAQLIGRGATPGGGQATTAAVP
jgi:AcrR family transcriptional regulator